MHRLLLAEFSINAHLWKAPCTSSFYWHRAQKEWTMAKNSGIFLLSVWVCVKITHSNRWHTVGWAGAFLLGSQAPFGFPGPHMGCGRALKGAGSYSISVQPTPSPSASNHFCTQFCPPVFLFLSVEFNEIAFFLFSLSNCNQVQWF